MSRIFLILPFIFLASGSMSKLPPPVVMGIETSRDYTPEELIRDVFLKGNCDNVSNVQAIGNDLSIGYFSGGDNIFGFSDGLLLTSGDIVLAEGPNVSVESGAQFGTPSSDPDINLFANNVAFDVGGIEFDFVPVGETVTFRYVFASEEYCEFAGSIFNDVFGFFVSGPGINGPYANNSINVALIPGTNDPVSINAVNHATNPAYYIGNELATDASRCGFPFQQSFQEEIEYDGMTVPFTATIQVVPCETYHIRMVVADVGDDQLDSGVFLESGSFDLGGGISVVAEVPGRPDAVAVEDCLDGQFVFSRPTTNLDDPLTINFSISPASTAENGVDFAPIPTAVTIPAGQSSVILPINVLPDGLAEPQESLTILLDFPCDCQDPVSATLFMVDQTPMLVENEETESCAGQTVSLGPTILQGMAPFTFLWENGTTDSTLTTTFDQNTTFNVTISDACGETTVASVTAEVQPLPQAELSGDPIICQGQPGELEVTFEGAPPWSFQYQIDGQDQPPITNIYQNPYRLTVTQPGFYELVQFADAQCPGEAMGVVLVPAAGGQITYTLTAPSCFNTADGAINLAISGGILPYDIVWSPSVNDAQQPSGLSVGTYQVQVTDATGCTTTEVITLAPDPAIGQCKPYTMYVPNAFSPNDDGFNDEFRFFPAANSNIAEINTLHIFNRWGAMVFEKNNFQPDADLPLWDGRFQGKLMDAGVFVWQAVLVLEDGSEAVAAGELLLVR